MSVLDEFTKLEQNVVQRLKELEPLVAEHRELRALAERLGIDASAASQPEAPEMPEAPQAPEAPEAPRTRARSRGSRPRRTASRSPRRRTAGDNGARRSAPGERAARISELVQRNPGITVAEAAKELGVNATGLYRPVRSLVATGAVRKDGTHLHPGKDPDET
jgi:hypothetical protein